MNFKIPKLRVNYPHKINALKYLLRNPSLALGLFRDSSKLYFSRTIENVLGLNIIYCLHNLLPEKFANHLKENQIGDHNGLRLMLYSIVRKYKPEIVVETGVSRGASSAFILCAMRENGKGHLYSIDLPSDNAPAIKEEGRNILGDGARYSVAQKPVGHLVPEYLKDRWTLILRDAKIELPALLKKTGEISIFFHDSLHTYEHMLFEYETAWPYISKGGLLLSHDVLWNEAFLKFSKKVKSKPAIYYSFGVIKKT